MDLLQITNRSTALSSYTHFYVMLLKENYTDEIKINYKTLPLVMTGEG